jgi:indole-3-glycerol phosphate synthase
MTILDKIIAHKRKEVAARREQFPLQLLEKSPYFERQAISLAESLKRGDKCGVIAEFKRRSPSKGDINAEASVGKISAGYVEAGASALSILTDKEFFGGSNEDLVEARKLNNCPILRKDFIIDEYQIVEARSIGADVVLLIAECLEKKRLAQLASTAKGLGLEVLMEIHSEDQLAKLTPDIDIVGVNNRDLNDFSVNIATSLRLCKLIPDEFVKVSESGIDDPNAVVELAYIGYRGFLIGEYFMKSPDPAETCREFIRRVESLKDLLDGAIVGS